MKITKNTIMLLILLSAASASAKELPKGSPVRNAADSISFENAYVAVMRASTTFKSFDSAAYGTRVVVALGPMTVESGRGEIKLIRGQIAVFKQSEPYRWNDGDFFEVAFKKDHPPVKGAEEWLEPEKTIVVYEDDFFRVFEERLAPGDTRLLHSHNQRIVVRLNEVQLTDPRNTKERRAGSGLQVPNTARFAEPVVHVVKNLSAIPLFNIVIEMKPQQPTQHH